MYFIVYMHFVGELKTLFQVTFGIFHDISKTLFIYFTISCIAPSNVPQNPR
jgi:hypothetical protein